jgi:peptide-methionine (R)-S-oxide reductase
MNDDEWQAKLTPEQFRVLRQKGTEAPGSGKYVNATASGEYVCAACGNKLFGSDTKFESSMPGLIGWPAFSAAASRAAVKLQADDSQGMRRTEIVCAKCGSHLGHLFEDDPDSPSGQHYCVNSAALDFKAKVEQ